MTTYAEQLRSLRDLLAAWARDYGGTAEIAGDAAHLFAMLAQTPGGVRACLWPVSEEIQGAPEGGRVLRKFWVVLSRGRGFALSPSDSLVSGTAAADPLFDLVGDCREVLRGVALDDEQIEYTGWQPFSLPTDRYVDAYQLQFQVGAQIPEPTDSI
jgi:hypothetical protein